MAVLYRLATTHFKHTHPTRHHGDPMPIAMQITFLRRTFVGPAILTVQDAKLGARTSTIHVALSQEEPGRKNRTDRVVGYITVSDPAADVGLTAPSGWTLSPPPPSPRPPEQSSTEPAEMPPPSNDGTTPWVRIKERFPGFRQISVHTTLYCPPEAHQRRNIVDQWARFNPLGPKGGPGRWTNEAMVLLTDLYPLVINGLDVAARTFRRREGSDDKDNTPMSWFPTVTLNVDFKRRLPPDGEAWLYSRVVLKDVRNGRTDIEVVLMNERGEIVALGNQVGLVLSATRNTSGRTKTPAKI